MYAVEIQNDLYRYFIDDSVAFGKNNTKIYLIDENGSHVKNAMMDTEVEFGE